MTTTDRLIDGVQQGDQDAINIVRWAIGQIKLIDTTDNVSHVLADFLQRSGDKGKLAE